jgi:hypothetical protein
MAVNEEFWSGGVIFWFYVPDFVGNVPSSSKRFWTHVMT